MAKALTKAQLNAQLVAIVAATQAGSFVHTPASVHSKLIEQGLVEINTAAVDASGNIATRATQAGIDAVTNSQNANSGAATASAPSFEIEQASLPPVSGRGRTAGNSKYPFDKLEVGQSFFVPKSDEMEDPAKALASTVASANKRYATETGQFKDGRAGKDGTVKQVPVLEYSRKFVARSRSAADETKEGFANRGDGVRIYRVK